MRQLNSFKGEFRSSFLSCEKDTESIIRKLFIDSRPYSDYLKRLLIINTSDCIDDKVNVFMKACLDSIYDSRKNLFCAEFDDLNSTKQVYKYVTFNIEHNGEKYSKTWLAENLYYLVDENGSSACYGNNRENCKKYGRLYTWNAALSACPIGWHLPSLDEWEKLLDGDDLLLPECVETYMKYVAERKDIPPTTRSLESGSWMTVIFMNTSSASAVSSSSVSSPVIIATELRL